MNDLTILAEDVMIGDYVYFGKVPAQVTLIESNDTFVYLYLNNGGTLKCKYADSVTILDDSIVEDIKPSSHKHQGDF